jgi:osmotically-inducible protein OsmY
MVRTMTTEETTDRELEQRVVAYLQEQQRHALRQIDVRAEGGTVTLRGRVGSFYEKQLCLGCLRRVPGVAHVVDQIDVGP